MAGRHRVLGAAVAEWVPGLSLADAVADGMLKPLAAARALQPLAAAAEAASTGARAVSKTKVRAVLSTWSRQDRAAGPPNRARPPWPPRACTPRR